MANWLTGDSPMLKLAKDYKKKIIAQNDWGEKKNRDECPLLL